jgi:hypothetical protein
MFFRIPGNDEVSSLSFVDNNIELIGSSAFDDFKNLKRLSLSHNNLYNFNPKILSNLKLEELDLSYNKLNTLANLQFEGLSDLKTLNLQGNALQHVPYKALNVLTSLEYLLLSHNEILILDFENAARRTFLNKLKVLDLSNNKIGFVGEDTFREAELLYENFVFIHFPRVESLFLNILAKK